MVLRIRVDGTVYDIGEKIALNKNKKHTIEVVIDRLIIKTKMSERITVYELALNIGRGLVAIKDINGDEFIFSEKLAYPM